MKTADTRGFTLIELIIVIAILAIISALAIGKFADLRKEAARKANVANIRNIARTIDTEIARRDGENIKGLFAYAESLVDAAEGGGDATGAAGSYLVRASWYDGNGGFVPGIYCGIKRTGLVTNAGGVGTGEVAAIADAHENNVGLESLAMETRSRGSVTPARLCLYYLTDSDVTALKEAGVSIVSRHNYSNQQSSTLNWTGSRYCTEMGLHATGGGPGMRPDLSACYPVVLTNGSAVAILNPAACESIYRDLGLDYASTYGRTGLDANDPATYFTNNICCKVYAFGLGRDCAVTTQLLEGPTRCPTLDRTHYRNYLMLFRQASGFGNSGSGISFIGIIDPAGNTAKQAQYDADWSS